ncbi:NAD-binding protein [Rickenella mellea]|uniref:NAD-binding protein n=1 Tax=Rickenella mellea TaxID=50990 RepID=A0A4Y7QJK5_9AGAM|nr:NAD-binding protein [Rickenella mellea]
MSPIPGIALLGAGLFAKEAHLPAIANLGSAAPPLRAVYSRSLKSAQDLASAAESTLKLTSPPNIYHDGDPSANLDTLLARSDVGVVIVILPITTQPDVILKSLAAGKHVLSEKPVAKNVKSGIYLIKEYEEKYKPKGLIWRVAENFEAEPGYRAAGQAIRDGKIGKVMFFRLQGINNLDQDSKWYKTPWRTVPDYQGGFLLDGGVHSAALLRVVLPSPVTHISSFASLNKDYLAPLDTINAVVKAEDGSHGIFELSFAAPTSSRSSSGNGFFVTGTDGWLEVANAKIKDGVNGIRITIHIVTKDKNGKILDEKVELIEEESKGVEAEISHFLEIIKGNDGGLGDPWGALKDVAFIQACLDSQGQLVDLGLPGRT